MSSSRKSLDLTSQRKMREGKVREARSFFASFSHIPSLLEIENRTNPLPWSAAAFAGEISSKHSYVLARAEAERVIGFLSFRLLDDELFILNFAVDPNCQRQGIGRQLLLQALEWAQMKGALWATLEVREGNQGARALYERFGFETIGRRSGYYSDNQEDALVLSMAMTASASETQNVPSLS